MQMKKTLISSQKLFFFLINVYFALVSKDTPESISQPHPTMLTTYGWHVHCLHFPLGLIFYILLSSCHELPPIRQKSVMFLSLLFLEENSNGGGADRKAQNLKHAPG